MHKRGHPKQLLTHELHSADLRMGVSLLASLRILPSTTPKGHGWSRWACRVTQGTRGCHDDTLSTITTPTTTCTNSGTRNCPGSTATGTNSDACTRTRTRTRNHTVGASDALTTVSVVGSAFTQLACRPCQG